MLVEKNKNIVFQNLLKFKKIGKTSNASYNIKKLNFLFPLQFKFKKLLLRKKWMCGRSNKGRITVFSKGQRSKKVLPILNYSFRVSSLFFIGGINYTNFSTKITSLIFSSTGLISYLPTRFNDNFFLLNRLQKLTKFKSQFYKELLYFKPFIQINEVPFMLIQQKKNSNISFLEIKPLKGSQYARSIGSSASIIKLDTRTGFSLVKLPSGVKKVFSAFSLAYEGPANISILKNQLSNTKSGFWRQKGFKSKVRGVAMNPVDHPHGGRTKAIKYPRTPWGKTTKFK